jgi:ATP-dependent RNA helicase DeaD
MMMWLNRDRFKREKEMIEELVAEGHDPISIAAAALKMARAEEKQRPIYGVREVFEGASRKSRRERHGRRNMVERDSSRGGERPSRGSRSSTSHEPGMVRLSVSKGRDHGVRPGEVVSTLAFFADIPGRSIGKIMIEDQHTLVDVPEQFVEKVLAKRGNYRLRKQAVSVDLA